MVKEIRNQAPDEIRVCYEAAVCGFVLQRLLQKLGCVYQVIAPSLVPIKPGIGSRRTGGMPASCGAVRLTLLSDFNADSLKALVLRPDESLHLT